MSAPRKITENGEQTSHLALLKKGDSATVTGIAISSNEEHKAIRLRLLELGFAAGEKIRVIAESFPRRDPMAVRVGNSTFALRRHEAALIQIEQIEGKPA
jgi:ferrous iron transport protein A